jgi:dipeptidyl aminopeptidase/acylaminoacyl peptidase
MKRLIFWGILLMIAPSFGQPATYRKPPPDVLQVLNAPAIPQTSLSPTRDKILLLEPQLYPPISEVAAPMLGLAGQRINPQTNGAHQQTYYVGLKLKNLADGRETPVSLPPNARIIEPQWSADGKYIAVGNIAPNGIELCLIQTQNGAVKFFNGIKINMAFGDFSWMPDGKSLLVHLVPPRGAAPPLNVTPVAPTVQETSGKSGTIFTFQDLLKSPHDELLFSYYATSQLAIVTLDGKARKVGDPAIFAGAEVSPDGRYLLTARVQKPFSYLLPASGFPQSVDVWDMKGQTVFHVEDVPLKDDIPMNGVTTARRDFRWIPTAPSSLVWAEALDGGDPKTPAAFRDKVMKLDVGREQEPIEIVRTKERLTGLFFGEKDGLYLFTDFNRDSRHRRWFFADYRLPKIAPKLISDLNVADRYNDIGQPVMRRLPNGFAAVQQSGDAIFLSGAGATSEGERPFLRRLNLPTLESREIWRAQSGVYESFVALTNSEIKGEILRFITRRESPSDPPNLFLRAACDDEKSCAPRQLTHFQDPTPQLRALTKRLVKYKRADGVDLSFTLYLPPNYQPGTRLPTLLWAYPLEFTNVAVAGQVSGSPYRFTRLGGASHLFFALQGYAVLDNATMPIVGDNTTKNDTFIPQIVASAQAAIDKAVEMGITDPQRVGVAGHSYGAFMTANLLAHSDLFRAGIARSGAYNRTLTPFGFQGEIRNFWEARQLYTQISPFFYADKIKEPLLLIHGEADQNQGTFPLQSERLFAALQGTGGTARLVMLPAESHGYIARESVEHTLFEMLTWFDKYVKNAPPRAGQPTP